MSDKYSAEDFVKIKFPTTPAISTNGDKIVFSIKEIDEKKNSYKSAIYLKTEDGYRKYTWGDGVDTNPKFSPDGKYMAFMSSRSGKGMHVFVMPVDGGEAQQVTDFPNGVTSFTWAPDSKHIHVIAPITNDELEKFRKGEMEKPPSYVLDPEKHKAFIASKEEEMRLRKDPRVITEGYYRAGANYLDGKFSQPFLIPIDLSIDKDENKKPIYLGIPGKHFGLGDITPDMRYAILVQSVEDPSISVKPIIEKVEISNPENRTILTTAFGWVGDVKISFDGKYVIYTGLRTDNIYDDRQIFLINIQDNTVECLTENYSRSAMMPKWVGDKIYFLSTREGVISIMSIDLDKNVAEIVGGDRNINSFDVDNNGNIVFEVSHYRDPAEIYTYINGREDQLTNANDKLIAEKPPAKVEYLLVNNDGVDIQTWLMLPSDHDGKTILPVALEIHGGPAAMWSPHEKTMWHEWNTLVSQGYAVVFCNPRGSDGYGIDFRAAVYKDWATNAASDILTALESTLDKYSFLDRDRVSVTGGSYGGYMTAWLVTTTHRFKAGVSQRGVYEIIAFGMTTDIPIWLEKQFGGELLDVFREAWDKFPVPHIKNMQTPLLIIHSDNDFRVPVVNGEQLFWLGKRYNKNVTLVRYPEEGHELSRSGKPRHIIDRINRIVDWFNQYT